MEEEAGDLSAALDRLAELVDGYEALQAVDTGAELGTADIDGEGGDAEAANLLDYLAQNVEEDPSADAGYTLELPEGDEEVTAEDGEAAAPLEVEVVLAPEAGEEQLEIEVEPKVVIESGSDTAAATTGTDDRADADMEDEETLAQKAMDAMLAGDMEAYEALNSRLVELQASSAMEKLSQGAESALNELKPIPDFAAGGQSEDLEVKMLDAAGNFVFTSAYYGSFDEVPVAASLRGALTLLGLEGPTQVQQYLWPLAMLGQDAVAIAPPRSGKTLAYLLPTFSRMLTGTLDGALEPAARPSILIMAPTKEASEQIMEEADRLSEASSSGAKISAGVDPSTKAVAQGTHVLLLTPGEALDLLGHGSLDCSKLIAVVCDSVDRMLDMGMEAVLRKVLELLRQKHSAFAPRQTLLCAASLPPSLKRLASSMLRKPNRIQVGGLDEVTGCRDARQVIVPCKSEARMRCLLTTLRRSAVDNAANKSAKAVVVCSSPETCQTVKQKLAAASVTCLLADGTGEPASKAAKQLQEGWSDVLVATDAALRGVELRGVPLLVSYDIPATLEEHLRRCARVGSSQFRGVVVTFAQEPAGAALVDIVDIAQRFRQSVQAEVSEMALGAARRAMRTPMLGLAQPVAMDPTPPPPSMPLSEPPLQVGVGGLHGVDRSRSPRLR